MPFIWENTVWALPLFWESFRNSFFVSLLILKLFRPFFLTSYNSCLVILGLSADFWSFCSCCGLVRCNWSTFATLHLEVFLAFEFPSWLTGDVHQRKWEPGYSTDDCTQIKKHRQCHKPLLILGFRISNFPESMWHPRNQENYNYCFTSLVWLHGRMINRILENQLRVDIDQKQTNCIPLFLMTYRSVVCESTGKPLRTWSAEKNFYLWIYWLENLKTVTVRRTTM